MSRKKLPLATNLGDADGMKVLVYIKLDTSSNRLPSSVERNGSCIELVSSLGSGNSINTSHLGTVESLSTRREVVNHFLKGLILVNDVRIRSVGGDDINAK